MDEDVDESSAILPKGVTKSAGLSLLFAVLCIVDLFGVFPIVTLPKAIIDCGLYGIPIVLCVFIIQIYAAILLGRCWTIAEEVNPSIKNKSRYPYAAVAELSFGPVMKNVVTVLLDATIFGGGVPNLLVASQNLQLFGAKMSAYQFNFSFCWWLVIIGVLLCPIMWLGSPKDMKSLSVMSGMFVSSVTIMVCYCIMNDTTTVQWNSKLTAPSLEEVLTAYGIIAFQFDIHPMLMTIQVDMKERTKISAAVIIGFFVTGTMFALTTFLAAYRYGRDIRPNILQGIPASWVLYVAVLLVTFQLCISSAIGNSPLFQHIEEKLNIPNNFNIRRCLIRSLIVAFAVLLGEMVPRFDLVMSLIGSTLTGPLMFILPPLFYSKLLKMKKQLHQGELDRACQETEKRPILSYNHERRVGKDSNCLRIPFEKFDTFVSFLIICFGVIVTIVATFYNWMNIIQYAQFRPSCLINITTNSFILDQ
ncbi:solute carrier family member mahogany [Arctopsyche grandis]|uniref:solute carrier family member mahogany n=1 Tax=Arctopsyche grandis TaxID=121162 RepID=UPI00406D8C48